MASATVIPVTMTASSSFLARGERVVTVDSGVPGSEGKITGALAAQGLGPGDVSLIVITHAHIDHVGSLARLKELTGAPVAVHAGDAEWLRKGGNPPLKPTCTAGRLMAAVIKPKPYAPIEPDVIVDGELRLDGYGVAGRIVPTPGHTPGSISVLLDGGDAIVGDLLMGMVQPTRPRLPMFADNLGEGKGSMRKLLDLGARHFYTAHGGPFEAEAVAALVK